MNDLISRQAVIDALNGMKIYRPLVSDRWVISDCLNKIVNLPSAERHGRWTREVLGNTSGYWTTVMYKCSACESMAISKYHYCPNCGARMDEVEG